MLDYMMYTLYIVLGIAPFSYVRYYPFRNKLRIKPKYFWFIYCTILTLEVVWFIAIEYNPSVFFISDSESLRMAFYIVYFLISIIFIKETLSKHLIVWVVCVIFSSTFTSFTFCMENIFPTKFPFLVKNISMMALLPFFIWFSFIFINSHIIPLINQSNKKIDFLISSLLMLIFIMEFITAKDLPYNTSTPFTVLGIRILASTITVIVCSIFSTIIKEENEKQKIMEDNKQKEKMLDISTQQFIALSDKIEETRRIRHDLKFHVSALKTLANKKDYQSILEYLETDSFLPNNDVLSFCNHPTLNIIFSYYRDVAQAHHIDFQVAANVSQDFFLKSNEIWVLLGNLLENSVEATKHIDEKLRQIKIKMYANEFTLVLTVDNPFNQNNLNQNGENFISTKPHGGVGLNSISFLAEKHNGLATFETKDDWFLSSVTMHKKS